MENIQNLIDSYIEECNQKHREYNKLHFPNLPENYNEFSYTKGKVWIRIFNSAMGQKSVHAFIDPQTGDMYMPASYNTPAKGIRGNLNNEKKPIFSRDFYKRL
jgi:hypothetical protein